MIAMFRNYQTQPHFMSPQGRIYIGEIANYCQVQAGDRDSSSLIMHGCNLERDQKLCFEGFSID
jgi:hypothetical protein